MTTVRLWRKGPVYEWHLWRLVNVPGYDVVAVKPVIMIGVGDRALLECAN